MLSKTVSLDMITLLFAVWTPHRMGLRKSQSTESTTRSQHTKCEAKKDRWVSLSGQPNTVV